MTNDKFKHYYDTPTKISKTTLDHARALFCETSCHNQCPDICLTHVASNTLKKEYKIQNHNIPTRAREHNAHPPPPQLKHPKPPLHILKNQTQFPIHSIINDRLGTYKDKNKMTKAYMAYLCQWTLPNEILYNKWLPQKELFPWNNQNAINHNVLLLMQYYTCKQHQHFTSFLQSNFNQEQNERLPIHPPATNHTLMPYQY